MMVAAHAYDLRAAAKMFGITYFHYSSSILIGVHYSGMRTVYIHRRTEDCDENIEQVRQEVDSFVDGSAGKRDGGLCALADLLGV